MRLIATLVFTIAVLSSQVAYSADRVALVIGNSNYRNIAPLANPKNDATDIAAALRKLGFDVTVRNNGPATATGTVLTAVLTGISSANVITAPSGCAVSGATVSCTLANLGKGAKVRRTISVVPDTAGTVRLSAAATSAAPDPNAANSSAVASASVR